MFNHVIYEGVTEVLAYWDDGSVGRFVDKIDEGWGTFEVDPTVVIGA